MTPEEKDEQTAEGFKELEELHEMKKFAAHNVAKAAFHDAKSVLNRVADEVRHQTSIDDLSDR